jgi:hypothetical protein
MVMTENIVGTTKALKKQILIFRIAIAQNYLINILIHVRSVYDHPTVPLFTFFVYAECRCNK